MSDLEVKLFGRRWRASKAFLAMFAAAALLFAAGTIALYSERQDRGWLTHPDTGAEAHWAAEDLPLYLLLVPDAVEEWEAPLRAGAAVWNKAADRELLGVVAAGAELPETGTLVLVDLLPPSEEDDPDARPHTTPVIARDGRIRSAVIRLPRGIPWSRRRDRIAAHELGHLLGLGGPGPQQPERHDDLEESAMFRRSAAPNGSTGTWYVTEADRQRLRRRYSAGPPGGPNPTANSNP